jgi:FkbM family methyltransferase
MVERVHERDAWESLTRLWSPDEPLTLVDVGANEGWAGVRMLDVFSNATVHAFEPAPDVFESLRERARERPGLRPVRAAAGDRTGTAAFHVTANRWCSSLRAPTAEGRRLHGAMYDAEALIETPVTTLDDWAASEGIERVDGLKIDAQGADLDVLRGARGLLARGVAAVVCEAALAVEYEGAATFSEIDLFLRERGFWLERLNEVGIAGPERRSAYVDGLWLSADARAATRKTPRLSFVPTALERASAALVECASAGLTRVAVYGGGRHTLRLARCFERSTSIVAVIDDDPARRGGVLFERPVVGLDDAIAMGVGAIVLSSDAHEAALWERSAPARARGIRVFRLYDGAVARQIAGFDGSPEPGGASVGRPAAAPA